MSFPILLVGNLIIRKHHSLGHEHLHDVIKEWIGVELKEDQVQDVMLLLAQFVLLGVESLVVGMHRMARRNSIHRAHVLIVDLLLIFLLLLAWFVSWQLPQELLGAWHGWVHLVVLGRNEEASQSLQHDLALLHVFLVQLSLLLREEEIQYVDRVVQRSLGKAQVLRHLAEPVHNETAHLAVLRGDLEVLLLLRLPELALGVHVSQDVRGVQFMHV